MSRLNILLLAILLLCALSLVNAQYRARTLFIELGREQALEYQLAQDWDRLQYEQSAQSKSARIESVARNQLHMMPANPGRTQYLSGLPAVMPPGGKRGGR
ncbi:hypothetical protein PATSB16_00090 [Pandoraea thiooxydans]|uniref:Cell division protein FtsL n=1 Tax=Pandoraea thiooxydans TaxID=445709 RepID=A0A0G3ESP6_9BURK|nr:cell division protein FtsL [Pandoraea thiooxydans]AKJ69955.1 cell division protein FtsL [Pandoraea thiooxydans]APR93353.1 hypothetical protein PATSB16_00090 [Pandoraea thiooxydans]